MRTLLALLVVVLATAPLAGVTAGAPTTSHDQRTGFGQEPAVDQRTGFGQEPAVDQRTGFGQEPAVDQRTAFGQEPAVDQRAAAGQSIGADRHATTGQRAAPVIVERVTLDRTPDRPDSVRVNVTYDLPDNVVSFTAETRYQRADAVTVAATSGFDRQSDGSFAWDERTTAPTLTFRVAVTGTYTEDALGVEADDWAFASLPNPYASWRYRGTPPSIETETATAGAGYASALYALDGAANVTTRTVRDVDLTLVVPPTAEPEASVEAYAGLYRFGLRDLAPGFAYDESGVFVLPSDRVGEDRALGTSTRHSFWVQDEYSALDGVENTPAHEFVHTRFGSFGAETGMWLTEATAEYYGHVISLNQGYGSWSEFRDAVTVEREAFRTAPLDDPTAWSDPLVPYEKGAVVLAALDAEIRDRTGGVRSLQDVLAYRFSDDDPYGDLASYENFSAAVVAASNDESMRDWLDRYVAGDETPPVPSDPDAFVLNASMDSDGDGVPNGQEVSTNPFDADTDDDGYDDAEDPYPTDASRPADTTTTTTATTTAAGDGEATSDTAATTASSGSTTDSDGSSTEASGNGEGAGGAVRDGDAIPGFGPASAALAVVLVALVVAGRERR